MLHLYVCQFLAHECGGNYSDANGILTSPSHPNLYPHLVNCVYLISQPNDTFVKLTFMTMDIICHGLVTGSDYIEIRDGHSEDSPLMGKFCGNSSNVTSFVQSTQNHLRLK